MNLLPPPLPPARIRYNIMKTRSQHVYMVVMALTKVMLSAYYHTIAKTTIIQALKLLDNIKYIVPKYIVPLRYRAKRGRPGRLTFGWRCYALRIQSRWHS